MRIVQTIYALVLAAVIGSVAYAQNPPLLTNQGSTTAGTQGRLGMGAVTATGSASFTTGQNQPLQLDQGGNLRIICTGCSAAAAVNATITNTPTVTFGTVLATMSTLPVNVANTPTVTMGTVIVTGSGLAAVVTVQNPITITGTPAVNVAQVGGNSLSSSGVTTYGGLPNTGANVPAVNATLTGNTPVLSTGSNIVGYVSADPCMQSAKLATPINSGASNATVQLVGTGASSKNIYVCGIMVVVAVPANVNLIEGTGSFCQTGSGALIGSTVATQGVPLATQGGFVEQGGSMTVAKTATAADNICIVVSTASQWSGNISYVQQ